MAKYLWSLSFSTVTQSSLGLDPCFGLPLAARTHLFKTLPQELGATFETSDKIPPGLEEDVRRYREELVESAVELDDAATEAYLEVILFMSQAPAYGTA